jgi:hypothetical protein
MSEVITKIEEKTVTVGFTSGGCVHAQPTGSGVLCALLVQDGSPWSTCKQTADTCQAKWDEETETWVWFA